MGTWSEGGEANRDIKLNALDLSARGPTMSSGGKSVCTVANSVPASAVKSGLFLEDGHVAAYRAGGTSWTMAAAHSKFFVQPPST